VSTDEQEPIPDEETEEAGVESEESREMEEEETEESEEIEEVEQEVVEESTQEEEFERETMEEGIVEERIYTIPLVRRGFHHGRRELLEP